MVLSICAVDLFPSALVFLFLILSFLFLLERLSARGWRLSCHAQDRNMSVMFKVEILFFSFFNEWAFKVISYIV